jgi:hypothetical protein
VVVGVDGWVGVTGVCTWAPVAGWFTPNLKQLLIHPQNPVLGAVVGFVVGVAAPIWADANPTIVTAIAATATKAKIILVFCIFFTFLYFFRLT